MDLPDAAVLPTLLARVAVVPVDKQRVLLEVLNALDRDGVGAGVEPTWLASLRGHNQTASVDGHAAHSAVVAPSEPKAAVSQDELKATGVSESRESAPNKAPKVQTAATETAPPAVEAPVTAIETAPVETTVTLRVYSTYGTGTTIGLTEVRGFRSCVFQPTTRRLLLTLQRDCRCRFAVGVSRCI